MKHLNIEIKAKCENLDVVRAILKSCHAVFKGCDQQTDTYFKVPKGRLKLREGNIENCLVYYERENIAGPKSAEVILYPLTAPVGQLREILAQAHGVLAVVEKTREIYFLENVHPVRGVNAPDGIGIPKIQDEMMPDAMCRKICDDYIPSNGVKFHLDTVPGLGTFVEIEAIDPDGKIGKEKLNQQCQFYVGLFQLKETDFQTVSYSDMLLNKSKEKLVCR